MGKKLVGPSIERVKKLLFFSGWEDENGAAAFCAPKNRTEDALTPKKKDKNERRPNDVSASGF